MLESLRIFRLVAQHASFTRAAEAAGLTRPAVSRHIRELEQHFGLPLMTRSTRQVSLTAAGEELVRQTNRVLAAVAELESAMARLRDGEQKSLVIGASTLPGEHLLPLALPAFRAAAPGVEVQVRVGNTDAVLAWLRAGAIDLALVGKQVAEPQLTGTVLAHDEIVLLRPPELSLPDPLPLAQLPEVPLILREPGSATRRTVLAALEAQGVTLGQLRVVAEMGSPEAVKAAVRSGVGCAFYSRLALRPGELPAVQVAGVSLRRPITACWRSNTAPAPWRAALLAQLEAVVRR